MDDDVGDGTSRGRLIGSLVAGLVIAATVAALASSSAAIAAPVSSGGAAAAHLRHLVFRALPYSSVLVDGPHVLLDSGMLIDERTATRKQIAAPPACTAEAIGTPWIAFDCRDGSAVPIPELYSLATGEFQPLALGARIASACAGANDSSGCSIAGVGRRWIEITDPECLRCASVNLFQNIETGRVRSDPTTASTRADLDAPGLAERVCSPLRLPSYVDPYSRRTLGALTFEGSFALAGPLSGDGATATYLERCGSPLHELISRTGPVAANARVVVWAPTEDPQPLGSAHLDGLHLPSLRRFVIPLPAAIASEGVGAVELSSDHLYVVAGGESPVYRAPSPS